LSSQHFDSAEEIIRNANIAMNHAKSIGKGKVELYSEVSRSSVTKPLKMEVDVRRAFANKEFRIYYQPIMNLLTSRLTGFEALLRWKKNDGSIVFPNDFIPALEETGLLIDVGHWTILEACRQIVIWEKAYPQLLPLTISINVSSNQVTNPDFMNVVRSALQDTGIKPSQLIFEITESIFIVETDKVSQVLQELQGIGVQVYLDDFGTGYSSLGYLTNFKIDSIKIDRVFINRIDAEDQHNGLLHTMLFMAKELNMDVVAEGIEREEQVVVLQKTGCKYGQGYFFNKPQDVDETSKYMEKHLNQLVGLPD
jgi:EAL domain-containing protein (putative c-di-GMP-specific phosphodiesterase class I)